MSENSTGGSENSSNGKQAASSNERNSLAAVLSKLQQIKTQGSLNVSGNVTTGYSGDNETALGTLTLPVLPPSQKISSANDKAVYKLTFAGPGAEFGFFISLPNCFNPTLLPDATITPGSVSNNRSSIVCRVCRIGFNRIEEREKHLSRKSIRITCTCSDKCVKNEAKFFNKCTFYLHLMNENLKTSTSQPFDLSKIKISKLEPEDYPMVSQEWFHALEKGAPSTESLIREKIKRIMEANKIWTENLPVDFCPVCEAKVSSVADHLQAFVPLEEQNCSLCSKTSLINPCAFSAHQSLHMSPAFRSCPECGLYVERIEDFNKHLKQCHHFNKISGFRCINCQLNFTKISVMVDHVAKKHSEFFFKCSECTLAFKSEPSVISHYASAHSTQVNSEFVKELQQLYKCLICEELTIGESAIKEHVSANHVNLSRVRRFFYFRCPSCSKVYESKAELVTHLASTNDAGHSAWKSNEAICDVCHETFPKYVDMVAHREVNHRQAIDKFTPVVPMQHDNLMDSSIEAQNSSGNGMRVLVCPHPSCSGSGNQFLYSFQLELHTAVNHAPRHCQFCESNFHGSSAFEKHLLIDHGKGNVVDAFECIFCQSKFDNSVTRNHHVTLFHGWGQNVGGGVSTSSASNSASLSSNNAINKLECKVCNLSFDKFSMCQDHFAVVHPSGFNFVCVNCPVPSDAESLTGGLNSSNYITFDSLTEFKEHQLKTHKFDLPKPAKIGRFVTTGDDKLLQTSALFSCIKGDFSTSDRAEFIWHIQQHVDKNQPWQCGECGFNMAQEAGLKSHLATQHNIKNYDEYKSAVMKKVSSQNGSEKSSSKPSLTAANPLVCAVCFRKFDQFVDYKSHRDSAH
ncbi:zinc finger protein 532-like [Convolutriloba macropyga]|uniref:zinc finger protein 532-like n=1 Tax=Convolutriloba macropyga TaxID=536237 RepID=UPI003F523F65